MLALMQLVERKQYSELESATRRVLNNRPGHPLVEKALTFALIGLHRYEEVLPILRHAVKRNPHDPELQNNLGIALNQLMYWDESLLAFEKAMQALPRDAEIAKHMGVALYRMQRWDEAIVYLLKAIELYDGDYVEAVELLAGCLLSANRIEEARICLQELTQAEPDNVSHMANLVSANLRRCYWDGLERSICHLRKISDDFQKCHENPFMFSPVPSVSRTELLSVSNQFARHSVPASVLDARERIPYVKDASRRIRLGYLSGDFRRHPVGFIIPEVIERHDRSRFEVFAYSARSAGADDPIRPRLSRAFDHFKDVERLSMRDLRDEIRADGIDVLIDLSGWTAYGRPEAFALRCAPVQVNWLGYPGSIGHPALADYLLGDPIVTPLEHANTCSETIAQLPHCYLPADTTRKLDSPPSRTEAGLPEDKFVFCSLNNSYKYNPTVWDLWCGILSACPSSVLWLTDHGSVVVDNLREEAQKRGVAPDRLYFAKHVPSNEAHLARLSLADLALDPFPYNSHSTGVDTLLAGVPMVTMLGDLFASRVGASMMTAAGLPELVTESQEAYRQCAVALYQDRSRLDELRARVAEARVSAPLFDMKTFTSSLEALYLRMLDAEIAGVREHISLA